MTDRAPSIAKMPKNTATKHRVFGVHATAPKLTRAGAWAITKYVLFPVFAILALFDGLGYLIARYVFGSCYGVTCLF